MDDQTKERGRRYTERYSAERCYISEWLNQADDEAVSVARVRVDPGIRTALHRLRGVTERYLILSGRGHVEVDGRERDVGPGDIVRIEAGEPQRITNTGKDKLTFLAVCTPRFHPSCYEPVFEE
jgi:mannose-6-phosphate isomerase-like protein (cupin superfamily)